MTYFVTDENGEPLGIMDPDAVESQATRLMYDMAVAAHEGEERLAQVGEAHLREAGPSGFGYVAAKALVLMAENIVEPILQVTDEAGINLRAGLAAAQANANETLQGKEES